ncbi:hypothetical protein G6F65_017654 [Rhizopus arrhizus]|nr:hypothetical protein G6F65_017654 [Rhizopus arrhizus]
MPRDALGHGGYPAVLLQFIEDDQQIQVHVFQVHALVSTNIDFGDLSYQADSIYLFGSLPDDEATTARADAARVLPAPAAQMNNGDKPCNPPRSVGRAATPEAAHERPRPAAYLRSALAGRRIPPYPLRRLHRCRAAPARTGALLLPLTLELRGPGGRNPQPGRLQAHCGGRKVRHPAAR